MYWIALLGGFTEFFPTLPPNKPGLYNNLGKVYLIVAALDDPEFSTFLYSSYAQDPFANAGTSAANAICSCFSYNLLLMLSAKSYNFRMRNHPPILIAK